MPRFLTGDELGNIKSVSYDPNALPEHKLSLKTLHDGTSNGRTRGVQKLAISGTLLASAHADGSLCLASLTSEDDLEQRHTWKETRFKTDQSFVGLASAQK
ncbi:hypothetical protein JVU11DRAFT_527 [Chiua virens]|nr:hypothetical protein JVU11DRAFT_527 [Chiua virens]